MISKLRCTFVHNRKLAAILSGKKPLLAYSQNEAFSAVAIVN